MNGPASTTPDGCDQNMPLWRKQFPIDTAADTQQTRREFAGGLAVAGGAMVCGQAVLNTVLPVSDVVTKDVAEFEDLPTMVLDRNFADLNDGEALLFHYPNHKSPALLVRRADDFVAFSQKCTHLACPVIPDPDAGLLQCPCHKGAFDLQTGAVVSGPPRRPLLRVRVERAEDGTLTATGVERA